MFKKSKLYYSLLSSVVNPDSGPDTDCTECLVVSGGDIQDSLSVSQVAKAAASESTSGLQVAQREIMTSGFYSRTPYLGSCE
jgi:hypothetical protein